MNIYSIEIATNVAFGYPTMVLGRMGSGKLYVAKEAIKLMKVPTLEISFYDLLNERKNYVPDWNGPLNRVSNKMQEVDAQIASNPEQILLYNCIEYAYSNPSWMMHMFMQMIHHRKVIMVGEGFEFEPILERCRIMEM